VRAKHISCLEDILCGLERYPELEPNPDRIKAMMALYRRSRNPVVGEMVEIWKSGHGVLSTEVRIRALVDAMNEAFS